MNTMTDSEVEIEEEVLSDVHLNVRPRGIEENQTSQSPEDSGKVKDRERSFTRFAINLEHCGFDGPQTQVGEQHGGSRDTDDEKKMESLDHLGESGIALDEDGDIIVSRQRLEPCNSINFITIEHAMKTTLADVGLQVWQGCLLLCNFILGNSSLFSDCIALELGGGTGLASIVMATVAKHVVCTDTGEEILEMCHRNVEANGHVIDSISKRGNNQILVRDLDWTSTEFDTDPGRRFHWSKEEIARLADVSVIIATDIIYSIPLTDAFFKTLLGRMIKGKSTCFISLEKRLNFTLTDLDVTCKEYDHFRVWLQRLETEHSFSVIQHDVTDLRQYIQCPRSRYLELWEIRAASGVS